MRRSSSDKTLPERGNVQTVLHDCEAAGSIVIDLIIVYGTSPPSNYCWHRASYLVNCDFFVLCLTSKKTGREKSWWCICEQVLFVHLEPTNLAQRSCGTLLNLK